MHELFNKNKKYKLNETIYFNTDEEECFSLQEARETSDYPDNARVIRKQIVSILTYEELDGFNKEYVDDLIEYSEIDLNSDYYYFIVNARTKRLLYISPESNFRSDLMYGRFTLIEEEN
jgi:hypothetical protein